MTELIQIVDEQDRPVGGATADEARRKGLYYRVSRVMVEDRKGRVLLQYRTNKPLYPYRWDNSAAGSVDAGETYLDAAKRELAEELGITGVALEEIGYYQETTEFADMILAEWNRVYRVVVDRSIGLSLQREEVLAACWFPRDEMAQMAINRRDLVTHGLAHAAVTHYADL